MFKPRNTPINNAIAGALSVPAGKILYALTVGRFHQIDWLETAVSMIVVGLILGVFFKLATRNGTLPNSRA